MNKYPDEAMQLMDSLIDRVTTAEIANKPLEQLELSQGEYDLLKDFIGPYRPIMQHPDQLSAFMGIPLVKSDGPDRCAHCGGYMGCEEVFDVDICIGCELPADADWLSVFAFDGMPG